MILQKEFYFVRHGQTAHNLLEAKQKEDHPDDISLNEKGRNQAKLIQSTISALPIQTVCSSPSKWAKETKEIITSNLQINHHEIHELGECSAQVWKERIQFENYFLIPHGSLVRQFIDKVRNGINQVLSLPSLSLIVAHGGVHWAVCCLLGINGHEWAIDNCIPVHFSIGKDGAWIAKKLR
jgi:uncharacterized phosphatase